MIPFDERWYLLTYPEVRRQLETGRWKNAVMHYHQKGSLEGKSPSPYFDEEWYRQHYPDVLDGIGAGLWRSGFHHYLVCGIRERRSPNSRFDEDWYLQANPDVAAAVDATSLQCGFEHFLSSGEFEGRSPNCNTPARVQAPWTMTPSATEDLFPLKLHVQIDPLKSNRRCLNIVLPTLKMEHMTGGPNTVLTLACELVRQGIPIRLLSSDLPTTREDARKLEGHLKVLSHSDQLNVEIEDGTRRDNPAVIGENDIFFATAWWTAQMISGVLPRMRRQTFFYMIQDFEPCLQAWSTNYALTLETYDMDIIPIINSESLRNYLVECKIGRFADPAFQSRILSFEPAVDRRYFHHEPRPRNRRRRLLFYARPTIGLRNLFEIGLSALMRAARQGAFARTDWGVYFIGESLPPTDIGNRVTIQSFPWLDFASYARLMRQSDVLLSLMLSPHPSYAPFEMAACSGMVVTNSYAGKNQEWLAQYSPNILAPQPYARTVAEAIGRATELAEMDAPPVDVALPYTWQQSFAPVLPRIQTAWESLK